MIRNISYKYLEDAYCQKCWSTVKIAKEFGCDPASIRYRLNKFGIKTRNFSDSHRIKGYTFAGDKEVLYGSLLGDGSLLRRNKQTGQGMASFSKANIGYDHVQFVARALLGQDGCNRIYEYQPKGRQTTFKITTKTCSELLTEYVRWYPNDEKVVPPDLVLTPKIILHWFMDDGHSHWHHKTGAKVQFSTESFTKNDCEFLGQQLEIIGLKWGLAKSHGGYGFKIYIAGGRAIIKNFFNLIGPCPDEIPSMKYKWKIPC
jgi:hypothetical protein